MSWPEALLESGKSYKEIFISAVTGLFLWAVYELVYGALSAQLLVTWETIPPEVGVRLIFFVTPGLLIGASIHVWRVKRETDRVRALKSATFYVGEPTQVRLATLQRRLARLGIKAEMRREDMQELIEYLDSKDIGGAVKHFAKRGTALPRQEPRNVIVPQTAPETIQRTQMLCVETAAEIAGAAFEGQFDVVTVQLPADVINVTLERTGSGWELVNEGRRIRG